MHLMSIIFLTIFFMMPIFSYAEEDYDDADYYLRKAKVEISEGMTDFALENLERAYKLDKTMYEAAGLMGDLYLKKGLKIRALDLYNESLVINETQDSIHTKIGEIEDYYNRNDNALKHFLRACELNTSNNMAHIGAARELSLKNDIASANTFYTRAYELKKAESDPLLKRSDTFYRKKQYDKAADLLKKAIEINPAARDLYFKLSAIKRLQMKNRESITILEKLAYLRPHDEAAFIQLAHAYYSARSLKSKRKEMIVAANNIERAIAINDRNESSHLLAAEIYTTIGDREKAAYHSKKAKEAESKGASTSP